MKLDASVIFSTYNSVKWLEKTLWGYINQENKSFEIVIADDGSTSETKELIASFQNKTNISIKHIWQPDNGFQKSQILNKAIAATSTPYLIFTDGDCIPRKDFVGQHLLRRKENHFLSGGYFLLPEALSHAISKEDIDIGNCFNKNWLYAHGLKRTYKSLKLSATENGQKVLNKITTTKPTWNGHNSSTWKENILAVNGFDERMQYGGQDREFGERLVNKGLKGIQIRYSAVCVHLYHTRGYKTKESILFNKNIRKNTRTKKTDWTPYGIKK